MLDRTDGVGSASARQGRTEYSRRGSAVKQGHAELDGDGRSRSFHQLGHAGRPSISSGISKHEDYNTQGSTMSRSTCCSPNLARAVLLLYLSKFGDNEQRCSPMVEQRCSLVMPTTRSIKCFKEVNTPAQERVECMQTEPINQTQTHPSH